jgi:uncharacterized protein DUF4062
MEKRHQVFVSSTFTDLIEERREVIQTLMQMDCIPAGMELFPAADEEQWAFIRKVIDDCDYYILIVGGRYGSTTAEGISYTEKEYDYAVSKGIHVIAFLHGKPDLIPVGKSDIEPAARKKLEEFREKVSTGRLIKFWTSTSELPGLVALSLSKAIKAYPRPGWVRGGSASNSELLAQINELRQKNDVLQEGLSNALAKIPESHDFDLAPADTKYHLKGTFRRDGNRYDWEAELSWDEIIALLGPHLFKSLSEDVANRELAASICSTQGKSNGNSYYIDAEVFNTMKIQLLALGYIQIRSHATTTGGVSVFVSLTPLGQKMMLRMRTIKAK